MTIKASTRRRFAPRCSGPVRPPPAPRAKHDFRPVERTGLILRCPRCGCEQRRPKGRGKGKRARATVYVLPSGVTFAGEPLCLGE